MAKLEPYELPDIEVLKKMSDRDLEKLHSKAKTYYSDHAMATPMDWFKHDSKARLDPDIQDLLELKGRVGYASYFMLIECLNDRPSHSYDLRRPSTWRQLMVDMQTDSIEEAQDLIDTFERLHLIDEIDEHFPEIRNHRSDVHIWESKQKYAHVCYAGTCNKIKYLLKSAKTSHDVSHDVSDDGIKSRE